MFTTQQAKFARSISDLIECNPFIRQRIELEKKALGKQFESRDAQWNMHPSWQLANANLEALHHGSIAILKEINRDKTAEHSEETLAMHLDLARFAIFSDFRVEFEGMVTSAGKTTPKVFERFKKAWYVYCPPEKFPDSDEQDVAHVFALLFQIRRAFNNIFQKIIGSCESIIQLRADVWRSIFTHDVRRYNQSMFSAMHDFPTLITGPTGSGKELVAQAIGLSGYVPLDPKTGKWETPLDKLFSSLNLSALSPTLIESELFGHKKGAFTGAIQDREGWLEACPKHGAVFLDEIGELDAEIQVKLLRVFEDRIFQRIGDTSSRRFQGRIVAATNRDLQLEVQEKRFRMDFYYRICADRILTPSLHDRVCDDPEEIRHLVEHMLRRIMDDPETQQLTSECVDWIFAALPHHPWPGNVRELDQCIRQWLLRKDYQPLETIGSDTNQLSAQLASLDLSAEDLVTLYCRVKYERNKSWVKTAKELKLDRRTVKSRVEKGKA